MGVVVMGVGICGSFPASGGLSYRELIVRAAAAAYEEAGVGADQVEGAVTCEEDLTSGYSIADEYTPDQLGMVRKSVYTINGDFLHGIGSAAMQIRAGQHKRLIVVSYSKASNNLTKDEILHFALDPVYNRFGVTPHFLAGIEMQQFVNNSMYSEVDVAEIAARARSKAMGNPLCPYGEKLSAEDVMESRPLATPLTELMMARPADAAIAVVLGEESIALGTAQKPVFLSGTGWGSGNSIIERRDHFVSEGTELAAQMAYAEADITSPRMNSTSPTSPTSTPTGNSCTSTRSASPPSFCPSSIRTAARKAWATSLKQTAARASTTRSSSFAARRVAIR